MRRTVAALVVVTALLTASTAFGGQEKFTFTGAPQSWIVPEYVTSATIDAYGAEGGGSACGHQGGLGGHAVATVDVVPGDTLYVLVGGKGTDYDCNGGPPFSAGGYNGGGDVSGPGPSGGGASDIRTDLADLNSRLVVAGGGGGLGGGDAWLGGAGGGLTGGDGLCCSWAPPGSYGGTGGTQMAGGTPGGAFGSGGAGGFALGESGGGGGWYGGGSGAVGGAGGGSGHGPPGTMFESGVRAGNGLVTITYEGALITRITKEPKNKIKTSEKWAKVKVRFSSEKGAKFRCRLDKADYRPCSSPYEVKAKSKRGKGRKHTISIQATDTAGNAGKAATVEFTVIRKR
jgi:hypothetical protein